MAWLGGENLKARRARRRQELDEAHRDARQQAAEARRLVQQQEERARRAIADERLRIARDLHDIVAHSISVIAVQAGVAHHVVDDRPEVARTALGNIEIIAREGLAEMRRMLGVLRSEDDENDHARTTPADGLRDVDRLLGQFRSAGMELDPTNPTTPRISLPRWTSPPTGSSRRASPTCCGTAGWSPTSTFGDHPPSCGSRSAMTDGRRRHHRPRPVRVTG